MKTQKITPKDRQLIVARVKAGEKQKDLADEFGVSAGLISRVVRQSRAANGKPEPKPTRFKDLSSRTTEQLLNRYNQVWAELEKHNKELYANWGTAERTRERIKEYTKTLNRASDSVQRAGLEQTIMGLRSQLSYLEECQKRAASLSILHQEQASLLQELSKRQGVMLPYRLPIS